MIKMNSENQQELISKRYYSHEQQSSQRWETSQAMSLTESSWTHETVQHNSNPLQSPLMNATRVNQTMSEKEQTSSRNNRHQTVSQNNVQYRNFSSSTQFFNEEKESSSKEKRRNSKRKDSYSNSNSGLMNHTLGQGRRSGSRSGQSLFGLVKLNFSILCMLCGNELQSDLVDVVYCTRKACKRGMHVKCVLACCSHSIQRSTALPSTSGCLPTAHIYRTDTEMCGLCHLFVHELTSAQRNDTYSDEGQHQSDIHIAEELWHLRPNTSKTAEPLRNTTTHMLRLLRVHVPTPKGVVVQAESYIWRVSAEAVKKRCKQMGLDGCSFRFSAAGFFEARLAAIVRFNQIASERGEGESNLDVFRFPSPDLSAWSTTCAHELQRIAAIQRSYGWPHSISCQPGNDEELAQSLTELPEWIATRRPEDRAHVVYPASAIFCVKEAVATSNMCGGRKGGKGRRNQRYPSIQQQTQEQQQHGTHSHYYEQQTFEGAVDQNQPEAAQFDGRLYGNTTASVDDEGLRHVLYNVPFDRFQQLSFQRQQPFDAYDQRLSFVQSSQFSYPVLSSSSTSQFYHLASPALPSRYDRPWLLNFASSLPSSPSSINDHESNDWPRYTPQYIIKSDTSGWKEDGTKEQQYNKQKMEKEPVKRQLYQHHQLNCQIPYGRDCGANIEPHEYTRQQSYAQQQSCAQQQHQKPKSHRECNSAEELIAQNTSFHSLPSTPCASPVLSPNVPSNSIFIQLSSTEAQNFSPASSPSSDISPPIQPSFYNTNNCCTSCLSEASRSTASSPSSTIPPKGENQEHFRVNLNPLEFGNPFEAFASQQLYRQLLRPSTGSDVVAEKENYSVASSVEPVTQHSSSVTSANIHHSNGCFESKSPCLSEWGTSPLLTTDHWELESPTAQLLQSQQMFNDRNNSQLNCNMRTDHISGTFDIINSHSNPTHHLLEGEFLSKETSGGDIYSQNVPYDEIVGNDIFTTMPSLESDPPSPSQRTIFARANSTHGLTQLFQLPQIPLAPPDNSSGGTISKGETISGILSSCEERTVAIDEYWLSTDSDGSIRDLVSDPECDSTNRYLSRNDSMYSSYSQQRQPSIDLYIDSTEEDQQRAILSFNCQSTWADESEEPDSLLQFPNSSRVISDVADHNAIEFPSIFPSGINCGKLQSMATFHKIGKPTINTVSCSNSSPSKSERAKGQQRDNRGRFLPKEKSGLPRSCSAKTKKTVSKGSWSGRRRQKKKETTSKQVLEDFTNSNNEQEAEGRKRSYDDLCVVSYGYDSSKSEDYVIDRTKKKVAWQAQRTKRWRSSECFED